MQAPIFIIEYGVERAFCNEKIMQWLKQQTDDEYCYVGDNQIARDGWDALHRQMGSLVFVLENYFNVILTTPPFINSSWLMR